MAFGTTTGNAILDDYLGGTEGAVTISLHTGAPGLSGTANEVTGGSYARQTGVFATAASAKSKSNTAQINFAGMPAVGSPGVTHFGIWVGGVFFADVDCNPDVVVESGNTFRINVGGITVTAS